RLLRAADGQRFPCREGRAKAFELGATQLARSLDLGAAAASPHRVGVERHCALARAQQDRLFAVRHLCRFVAPSLRKAGDWPRASLSYSSRSSELRVLMPLDAERRVLARYAPVLDLPPPFRAVALREVGDAFVHAKRIAADAGAGTLVHVGRFDLVE